jgi:NTE family protein
MPILLPGRVGLALGSGAARGWAHIGVVRALEAAGIQPDVVCGSSVGAIVGAAYASGNLDAFEKWVSDLDRTRVLRNLDLSFRGGLLKGTQFFSFMSPELPDAEIGALDRSFGAVATDLVTGHEVWLREGSLHDALRASVAMPGLITPAEREGRWLVDGGLVNPVPVSLCRAMGADSVIAVDLNSSLLGRRGFESWGSPEPAKVDGRSAGSEGQEQLAAEAGTEADADADARDEAGAGPLADTDAVGEEAQGDDEATTETGRLLAAVEAWARELRDRMASTDTPRPAAQPSLYEVLANSLNIMQVRITRSRMAGDPPDLLVTPRLGDFALLDLDRGDEAIAEGRRATERALSVAGEP